MFEARPGSGSAPAADAAPGPHAAWVELAARPADAASLVAIAELNPAVLTGAELVDAIVAVEKVWSLVEARRHQLRARLAEPFVAGDPMRLAARLSRRGTGVEPEDVDSVDPAFVAEAARSLAGSAIAAALRIPTLTAGHQVAAAQDMATALRPTLDALEAGRIDPVQARIVRASTVEDDVPGSATAAVQELVLPDADGLSRTEFRERVAAAVITVDPRGARERHESAAARRHLRLTASPDAMATLAAHLPADAGVTVFQLCDLLATQTAGQPGDDRGIGARRVDALVDLADTLLTTGRIDLRTHLGHAAPGTPDERTDGCTCHGGARGAGAGGAGGTGAGRPAEAATRQGRRPHLTVTLSATTLAGLDDLPGFLAGHGAVPADLARAIAASAATVTTLAVDGATGTPVAAGALTYRPRQAARDRAAVLHGHCRFPSCRQPAWRCDLDHREAFDHDDPARGGRTTVDNLQVLCRRHHLTKHHADWRVVPDREHLELTWTSPTGHRHRSRSRAAAVPESWLSRVGTATLELATPGRAMADDLDRLAGTWTGDDLAPDAVRPSLADLMIRHAINQHRCGGLRDAALTALAPAALSASSAGGAEADLGGPPF